MSAGRQVSEATFCKCCLLVCQLTAAEIEKAVQILDTCLEVCVNVLAVNMPHVDLASCHGGWRACVVGDLLVLLSRSSRVNRMQCHKIEMASY